MAFATWWCGDQLPALAPMMNFAADVTDDAALLARLANLDLAEVQKRLNQDHRPYVAWLEGQPVAYGWVATHTAHIGELDATVVLAQGNRYLWDFATLPAWRGRGIYPRLLQAILQAEQAEAERFWIIAAPENHASSAGIAKAGFRSVAHLSFQRTGQPGLIAMEDSDRVYAAAALLQLSVLDADPRLALSPCWHCAIDAREEGLEPGDAACWPDAAPAKVVVSDCCCS